MCVVAAVCKVSGSAHEVCPWPACVVCQEEGG